MTSRRNDSGLDGILLIDKPAGWTSHDVVAKARRITGQRRIGHTGTLDPMATGLLVLCLGRATRLVEYLTGHDKRYEGTITLGRATTTDDAEGETLAEAPVPDLTAELLERHLDRFRGSFLQVPPGVSAIRVGGKRAHALARAGETPEMTPRAVAVHSLTARVSGEQTIDVDVTCSAGTYIRSIARDLGRNLGCGGHLSRLRRLSAGPFSLTEAVTLADVEGAAGAGELEEILLQADDGLASMDAALVGAEATQLLLNGVPWRCRDEFAGTREQLRIYGPDGEFIGVGRLSSLGELRASKVILRAKSEFSRVMFDTDSH